MITICLCGQTACFIKKIINQRNNHIQIALYNQNPNQYNNNLVPPNPLFHLNNQCWNDDFCSNASIYFLMICILVIIFSHNSIYNWSSLNEVEKMQLKYNSSQLILNVFIPIIMYVKNNKLFKHVKTEIYG